jgi:hypothetical protein
MKLLRSHIILFILMLVVILDNQPDDSNKYPVLLFSIIELKISRSFNIEIPVLLPIISINIIQTGFSYETLF